jgi:hypothetical protein
VEPQVPKVPLKLTTLRSALDDYKPSSPALQKIKQNLQSSDTVLESQVLHKQGTLNGLNRKESQSKITRENEQFVRRLLRTESTLKLDKEREEQNKLLKLRLSCFQRDGSKKAVPFKSA